MKRRRKQPARKAPKRAAARPARKSAGTSKPRALHGPHPPLGLEASVERVVPFEWTIQAINSILPPVLSTPAMIGLMEHATVLSILPQMAPGVITVGTRIEVDHLKAVPHGATIRASAKLVKHEGRFLVFDVEARSGEHVIGRGRVFRAVVEPKQHGAKAHARTQPAPAGSQP
ncbi:MAG: thioesterase [Acidobacteriia bacterium]|nr:thioesterase [Terriglobia bacterium]